MVLIFDVGESDDADGGMTMSLLYVCEGVVFVDCMYVLSIDCVCLYELHLCVCVSVHCMC